MSMATAELVSSGLVPHPSSKKAEFVFVSDENDNKISIIYKRPCGCGHGLIPFHGMPGYHEANTYTWDGDTKLPSVKERIHCGCGWRGYLCEGVLIAG